MWKRDYNKEGMQHQDSTWECWQYPNRCGAVLFWYNPVTKTGKAIVFKHTKIYKAVTREHMQSICLQFAKDIITEDFYTESMG